LKSEFRKPASDAERSDRVEELLAATNSGAAVVRPLFTTFLVFIAYVAVIVGSTTDEDLLRGISVKLPLLDANISIVGFYVVAPALLIVLHFWLLLHFSLICENLHSLLRVVSYLGERQYSVIRQRLDNFTILHGIAHEGKGAFRLLLILVNALILAAIPIAALLLIQARFVAYHDTYITWWHRCLVVMDVMLISYFWPLAMRGEHHEISTWLKRVGYSLVFGWNVAWIVGVVRLIRIRSSGILRTGTPDARFGASEGFKATARFLLISPPIFVSVLVLAIPYEGIDRILYEKGFRNRFGFFRPDVIHEVRSRDEAALLPFVRRNLSLEGSILVKTGAPASPKLAHSDATAISDVTPLSLARRNLSFARLDDVVMPKANLHGAILIGANFEDARLEGASFTGANLSGANLSDARLMGANFSGARMHGTSLSGADLRFATFSRTVAALADFSFVHAGGARLYGSYFAGVLLQHSDLRGARVTDANFAAAYLVNADLPIGLGKVSRELPAAAVTFRIGGQTWKEALRQYSIRSYWRRYSKDPLTIMRMRST
jgi:uncharacterized protein YjbI with pentapeptide repeats